VEGGEPVSTRSPDRRLARVEDDLDAYASIRRDLGRLGVPLGGPLPDWLFAGAFTPGQVAELRRWYATRTAPGWRPEGG
jgi:hypothetical protein